MIDGSPRDRLNSLLAPASIAVVGASDRPGPGRQVLENLRHVGYRGEIIPIHPNRSEVGGRRCYSSLSAAHEDGRSIEAVAVLLGRDRVAGILEEAGEVGARGAWAFASGFAEAGADGRALQERVERICRRYGIAFCGPNCVGYVNPVAGSATFSAPLSPSLRPGRVSAVAQSGSICMALANSARGIGFRLLISSGNEAVLDLTDYLDYLLEDPETDVVLAFVEEFRRPARFVETARRARSAGKPLIVLKVGRSEIAQRAAAAHTGALAGADAVHDAVFEKHGVLRVADLDEMLETAEAFAALGADLPRGNRVGMLAVSGGEIGLIGDLSRGLGLRFPDWSDRARAVFSRALPDYAEIANPLDAWGSGRIEETYAACIDAAADDDVDLLIISQDAPRGLSPAQVEQFSAVARAAGAARQRTGKPIVAISHVSGGLDETLRGAFGAGEVPLLQGTSAGLRAASHLIAYAESGPIAPDDEQRPIPEAGLPEGMGTLDEIQSQEVLSAWGLSYPPQALCGTVDEAIAAAAGIGYPVAVKVVSPDVPHKSDAGAVRTGIAGPEALRAAFDAVVAGARRAAPGARIRGVLVQRMVTTAVAEVILGVSRDAAFGPVVVFGAGGRLVELLGDRSLAVPPVTRADARRMIDRTIVGRLIAGYRGAPPGDDEALIEAILAVGRLAEAADRVTSIDVNPLLVLPKGEGVVAVDALIEIGDRR